MPPKISVLVPVFNGERYLAECLDSVLAQDFADYELLIGDDGSTDGSVAMVERYAARDPRIRWWRNSGNLGIAGSFNACLQNARGDYIKYVLQDDKLMSPNALRLMAGALDEYPTAAMAVSATQLLDGESRLGQVRDAFHHAGLRPGRQVIIQCLEEQRNPIGEPSTVMFRRKLAARGFHPDFHLLIDLEMWFYLLAQGDFAYLVEPLCAFRTHPDQYSEVCRQAKRHQREYPQLLAACLAQPWFRQEFPRAALFANIYAIQKWKSPADPAVVQELVNLLTRHWYYLYYVKYKVTRPPAKLLRHVRAWRRKLFCSKSAPTPCPQAP